MRTRLAQFARVDEDRTLVFPGSADGPWARYVTDGVVHYPRLVTREVD